jgi:hypothetical protein
MYSARVISSCDTCRITVIKISPRDTLNIFSKASSGLFLIYKVEVFDELCQAIYRINIQGIAVY